MTMGILVNMGKILGENHYGNLSKKRRLATSRPLGERSEPCLAAKRPTASDEGVRGTYLCALDKHLMADPMPATKESGKSSQFIIIR